MTDQPAAAEQPATPLAERLAAPLRIDFDKLADSIRTNEQGKTLPDGIRELFGVIARSLRNEVPELDERQIGRVLLAAASVTAVLADDGEDWTALSIVNTLASIGWRLWRPSPNVSEAPDFFRPGFTYVNGSVFQPPEVAIVFRCVTVADHPRSGAGPVAFGFACRAHPGDNWTHYLANQDEWDEGWRVYRGLTSQPGEQPTAADEVSTTPDAGVPQACPHPTMELIVSREETTCGTCKQPVDWADRPIGSIDA
jgi:hypothetical protein